MKLTPDQILWIRNEQNTLKRIIDSNPKYGIFRHVAKLEALNMISKIHNVVAEKQDK